MRHNYVYYVHLQCFEPLFCQIGKDSLPSEISSEYRSCLKKRREVIVCGVKILARI